MSEKNVVQVVGPDELPSSVFGQDTKDVLNMQLFFIAVACDLGRDFTPQGAGSALLGATVNYLLTLYTVDSVKDVLEGVIPNLQAMHDAIENELFMSMVNTENPQ